MVGMTEDWPPAPNRRHRRSSGSTASAAVGVGRRFVERHGWRAYTLPILIVVAIAVTIVAGGKSVTTAAPGQDSASPVVATTYPQAPSTPAALRSARSATNTVAPDPCAANTAAQLVLVSVSQQHAWMCAGTTVAGATAVTTGALVGGDQTPTGSWTIQAQQVDRNLTGPGYSQHVHYWMPYDGDFGLHDATWQTFAFGSDQWRTDGSHGCVHFPLPAMTWLYQWARTGTIVTVTV